MNTFTKLQKPLSKTLPRLRMDQRIWNDLKNVVRPLVQDRLAAQVPYGEQDHKEINTIVRKAKHALPLLQQYQDAWPADLYIRRFLHEHNRRGSTTFCRMAQGQIGQKPTSLGHAALNLTLGIKRKPRARKVARNTAMEPGMAGQHTSSTDRRGRCASPQRTDIAEFLSSSCVLDLTKYHKAILAVGILQISHLEALSRLDVDDFLVQQDKTLHMTPFDRFMLASAIKRCKE